MKLRELNEKFQAVKKVYDYGVKEAQRKIELRHGFNELKGWVDFIQEEGRRIHEEYSDPKTGKMSKTVVPIANNEMEKVLEGDVTGKIENPLRFTEDEVIRASEIDDENKCLTGSEIALIYDDFVREEKAKKGKKDKS